MKILTIAIMTTSVVVTGLATSEPGIFLKHSDDLNLHRTIIGAQKEIDAYCKEAYGVTGNEGQRKRCDARRKGFKKNISIWCDELIDHKHKKSTDLPNSVCTWEEDYKPRHPK